MVAGGIEKGEEEREFLLGDKPLDDAGGHQSLLGVQVSRRLVNQVNISRFPQTQSESNSLQLTTRQVRNLRVGGRRVSFETGSLAPPVAPTISYFLVNDALDLHGLHDIRDELWVNVGVSDLFVEQSSDGALNTHQCWIKNLQAGDGKHKVSHCQVTPKTVQLTLNFGLMVCGLKLTLRMGMSPETEKNISVCAPTRVTPVCDKLSPPSSGLRDPANILINVVFPVPVTHKWWESSMQQLFAI